MTWNSRGSEWHRWDPHIHAPGTLFSDQFDGDWDSYLSRIEEAKPEVRALGVTDYFCIETYTQVRAYKARGRLANVEHLFPNVELRLDVKTEKKIPINIHLLFSPDDDNHEFEIERILGRLEFEFQGRSYRCTLFELSELGRAFDPKQADERGALRTGAQQFKVTLQALKKLFRSESWLQKNCLVAVAGSDRDGTAGLQKDDSFAATRQEIEAFADIIFAATPNQRLFWLGQQPNADRKFIEKTYRALKPCLHGSDAHRQESVVMPSLNRYCWLKGDLAFETLRQAVIEPEERVWLGDAPPTDATTSVCISSLRAFQAPWLNMEKILLNPGLIAIIGARGSGKTALVDLIAAASGALASTMGESSFLQRASRPIFLLGEAEVELGWVGGSKTKVVLSEVLNSRIAESEREDVCYLSQHFVERLCAGGGLATELREEMERVVFDATEPTDRLEANSFDDLLSVHLEPIRSRRQELQSSIHSVAQQVIQEELLDRSHAGLIKDAENLSKQIARSRTEVQSLLPKGKGDRARRLDKLEKACSQTAAKVETLQRRRKQLEDLDTDVEQTRATREPDRHSDMMRRFDTSGITPTDWLAFRMVFEGDVDAILKREKQVLDRSIVRAKEGDPSTSIDWNTVPDGDWPLERLREARDRIKEEVGIDKQKHQRYERLQSEIGKHESALQRLNFQIQHAAGAKGRWEKLIRDRRARYAEVFDTYVREERILEQLYSPLAKSLADSKGALAKLGFVIKRQVDLDKWVTTGETLLDLRRESDFRGYGTLRRKAAEYLLEAWTVGSAEAVASAMDRFRNDFQAELRKAKPGNVVEDEERTWNQKVADWLYDTSHVDVQYSIHYDGVAIEQLSPGTRGIVLLLLYLAVDQQDRRPLIVDQPEENLDPDSVFAELVPHFRTARRRRQIIVVTHNANLVVNTDADQIVVAESLQEAKGGLPKISYRSGSIENPAIRSSICQLLEGGERAFLEREKRYRLRWGQPLQDSEDGELEQIGFKEGD